MRNRVDKLGVASPEIREQSPDQIVIQLAGVHDPAQAAQMIGKTGAARALRPDPGARLAVGRRARATPRMPYTNLYDLLTAVQSKATTGAPTRLRPLQAGAR